MTNDPESATGERPVVEPSAAAAVTALQAQLGLADGNLDALDRKAALLPAFLAALAGIFVDERVSGSGVLISAAAVVAGVLAVSCALYAMRARAHAAGPDVDQVVANLDLPAADFNAALATSLAIAVNNATTVAIFKARWLNRAMVLAVGTILLLSISRFSGGLPA